MGHRAILLPGAVLPAELAYPALIEALGDEVLALAKDLEVYATDAPPAAYGLETEIEGVLRTAETAGLDRFHLVGYSGGGAIAAALTARHPERVDSLALLEPAWFGNRDLTAGERRAWAELDRIAGLAPEEMMAGFVRVQLAPGVEPPAPAPGPPPPWMAKRPAGVRALIAAFRDHDLDLEALRAFDRPVYCALGARSNPDYYGAMARRIEDVFDDCTLDVYEDRHHFDPPHRVEPDRVADRLRATWQRAAAS